VDRKSTKDILQMDVKKLASKQIFAKWQTILNEYLKDSENDFSRLSHL
jgi:hypothetical protein